MSQIPQIDESVNYKYRDFINYDNGQFKELRAFLTKYKITNPDVKANICDINPNTKCRYFIEEEKIPEFFEKLESCRKQDLVLNFTEMQTNDVDNGIGSGIMLDFDILTEEPDDIFANTNFMINDLISAIYKIVCDVIDIPDTDGQKYTHYVMIIKKPKPLYKEELKKYKQGFHIIMPNIMVMRNVKKFIFERLLKSEEIKEWFEDIGLGSIEDILDKGSVHVPVHFIGHCKPNSTPYNVNYIAALTIRHGVYTGNINHVDNISSRFTNLIYEFSLNHQKEDGLVDKKQYSVKQKYYNEVNYYSDQRNSAMFDLELEKVKQDISLKSIYIPDILYIKNLLGLLSIERLTNYNSWLKVIFALASGGHNYKSLAIWVSKRVPEKFNMYEFEGTWSSAANYTKTNQLTIKSIRYWAQVDSPDDYEKFSTSSICDIIRKDLRDEVLSGDIYELQFANYLKFLFENKFITDNRNNKYIWYEFITDEDTHVPGEVYKYRMVGENAGNLFQYIGDKLPSIMKIMALEIDYNIQNCGNTLLIEYLTIVKKKLTKSMIKLYKTSPTSSIIAMSKERFHRFNFSNELDKDPSIMGVGNGVLKFKKESSTELIQSYHPYYISMYTSTNYIPYDENNVHIKKVYSTLRALFPDDEQDVFEFLMYYFASSLDGFPKESMIMILTGCGANGKSFLVEFIKNTLGDQYVRKIGIQFLLEGRGNSSNADPAMMDLKKARQAYYSETNQNEKLNTAKLKEVTGQETMSARQLFQEQENFKPNCNHLVTTNHGFTIETTEHATWRRILTVSFKMVFMDNPDPISAYERKGDPSLIRTFITDDDNKSALLSILTHYREKLYGEYDGNLLSVPKPTIDRETNVYRSQQDIFNRFIDERAIISDTNEHMDMDSLSTIYRTWYKTAVGSESINNTNMHIHTKYLNSKIGKYFTKLNGIDVLRGVKIVDCPEDLTEMTSVVRLVDVI